MTRFSKIFVIIIVLFLLVVLAVNITPVISAAMNQNSTEQTSRVSDSSKGAKVFENFLSSLNSAKQYSFCVTKSVTGHDVTSVLVYGCTIRGDDYAIKIVEDDQELRQLYIDGEYMYINDTAETVYMNVQEIDIPDIHFQEALTGRLINTSEEIIDGNQVICVEIYKNGTVYAFYFDQQEELIRFYYIYDNHEITIDFHSVFIDSAECACMLPSSYTR